MKYPNAIVKAQINARDSDGSWRVWWKFMRKEGSIGEVERWFVSCETRSGGRSYGAKMSAMVSSTPAGSEAVWFCVSFNVARYDSLYAGCLAPWTPARSSNCQTHSSLFAPR